MSEAICKCSHPFSIHTQDVRGNPDELRVDEALLDPKARRYDWRSDREVGTSGCTQCGCRAYDPT